MKRLAVLIIVILASFLCSGCAQGQPVEIIIPPPATLSVGQVYIGGAVQVPGIYPLEAGDTIEALLQAAGGPSAGGNLTLSLAVSSDAAQNNPQKVNINRAETWLLQALPGVGQIKAQAIVTYRSQHGPFENTIEIEQVDGFGAVLYEQIKDLITVTD